MDVDECRAAVRAAVEGDTVVRSLHARIARALGGVPSILCVPNTQNDERLRTARAYFSADAFDDPNPQPPDIVIVASRVATAGEVVEVLRHELTHAGDHCENRRDLRVCEELACSEVKAHLAAECAEEGSRMAGIWSCSAPAQWFSPGLCDEARRGCVRRNAVRATSNVFAPAEARECVERVFERCYAEGWPPAAGRGEAR